MDIICRFRSVQEMARAVRESAELIEGQHYSPRPWNRFNPEDTDWWIVPSTDWPAYRYGKGMLKPDVRFPDHILCGLYVEKGFAPLVLGAYPELGRRGHVIDEGWAWFKFLDGLSNGSILCAAQTVTQETGSSMILEISSWYTSSPVDFEPHPLLDEEALAAECRSPLDGGRVWFTVTDGELKKQEERCIQDVTAPLVTCRDLGQLAEAFRSTPEADWAWIDVYIGVLVKLARDAPVSSGYWEASEVWRKLIHPWRQWIV